jgi:hypothetical protein
MISHWRARSAALMRDRSQKPANSRMSKYDLESLAQAPTEDVLLNESKLMYHCLRRPNELIRPESAQATTAFNNESGHEMKEVLQPVEPERAMALMSKLIDFSRTVYSCDGIDNHASNGKFFKICTYCSDRIQLGTYYYCTDCRYDICRDCHNLPTPEEAKAQGAPDIALLMLESNDRCKRFHNLVTRTYSMEMTRLNLLGYNCDECKKSLAADEKKFFNLCDDYDVCMSCLDAHPELKEEKKLMEYTPGMTVADAAALFDVPTITSEYREAKDNFGSLLYWVPVFEQPATASVTAVAVSDLGGQIVVNCNTESKFYGRVGIVINEGEYETWYSQGEQSLQDVVTAVEKEGGLIHLIVSKRFRHPNTNQIYDNGLGARVELMSADDSEEDDVSITTADLNDHTEVSHAAQMSD